MGCVLLCKSIPPRSMFCKHIQHSCKGSAVVDVIVGTIFGDVATVAAVVVVVVVAVGVVVVVVATVVAAVAVDTAIVSEIKLVVNKFANVCRFCVEGPIVGVLLM